MCLWTASRPLTNGARASTRTHPITAHRKCQRSCPPRVAWHIPPLLPSEKEARGSYKKPGEPLTALSLQVEAKGLFPQHRQGPAIRTRTHRPGKHDVNPSLEREKSPWRSEITPPGPRGLHPAGALAHTHQNLEYETPSRQELSRADPRRNLRGSASTPPTARGLLSDTRKRGTPSKDPKTAWTLKSKNQ